MASKASSGIWKDSQHLLHTYVTVCSQQLSIPTMAHESKRIPVPNFRPAAEADKSIHSASPRLLATRARQLDGMESRLDTI